METLERLVAFENDAMLEGKEVSVLPEDDHQGHIDLHWKDLGEYGARQLENKDVSRIKKHIEEHKEVVIGTKKARGDTQ